jgi:lipopolysaccharide export system permease protein
MLFDSTLRRELARNFGGTLVVILTIVLTIMFIRNLGQAAAGRVSPQDVMLLLAYIGLGHLSTMLALSLFVAVVATLSRMYRGSEMTIWFASGVPLGRFVRPVLRTSWPVLLVIGLLSIFVWPWQNERSAEAVTSAKSGSIQSDADGRFLILNKGQRNEQDKSNGDKMLSRFETYRAQAGDRVVAAAGGVLPRALPTAALLKDPSPLNQGELIWRVGLVLAAANMLLLGIGMSASNPRHASNWNLLFALLTFFVYYNLINLSQSWVGSGRVGLGVALLALHGSAFAIALAMIWWRENGMRRVAMTRRRGPRAAAAATAA